MFFLIWNFNEDFHGGFQVAARRVAMLESLRCMVAKLLDAWEIHSRDDTLTQNWGYWSYVLISYFLLFLVALAPSCYSSYVLPSTRFFKELFTHKVYLLMTGSLCLDSLASFSSSRQNLWLELNGWVRDDVATMYAGIAGIMILFLVIIFGLLHRMSVWGPWAMRDFTCLVPPGSLLCTLAFWDLGILNYRSRAFIVALALASVIDVARAAAMWMAILITLSNKWYALVGSFLSLALTCLCRAASPLVVDFLGTMLCGFSPVYDSLTPDHAQVEIESLEKATLWSTWPLAIGAWILQLCAFRYFNFEVLTYKGHGDMMPDGKRFGPGSEAHRLSRVALAERVLNYLISSKNGYHNHAAESDSSASESGTVA